MVLSSRRQEAACSDCCQFCHENFPKAYAINQELPQHPPYSYSTATNGLEVKRENWAEMDHLFPLPLLSTLSSSLATLQSDLQTVPFVQFWWGSRTPSKPMVSYQTTGGNQSKRRLSGSWYISEAGRRPCIGMI